MFSGWVQRLFSLVLLKVTCETMFGICNNWPNDPFTIPYKVCKLYSIATDLCYFGRKGQCYAVGNLKSQGASLLTIHLRPLVIHWISVSYLFIFLKIVIPVCSTLILSCKNVSIHILCLSVFAKIISGSCFCCFGPKFSEDGRGPTNDILSVFECILTRYV